MTEPGNSQTKAQVAGAKETRKLGQPDTLAEYVIALVHANSSGVFTEISFDGTERSRTYGDMFADAKQLAASISSFQPKDDEFVLLCFETVTDYVPAAWACLLNGYSFLPLSISDFFRSKDEFADRAQRLMGTLRAPLVLTEARFEEFLSSIFAVHAKVIDTKRQLATRHHAARVFESAKPGDILIETSGTTGGPKLARLGGDKIINRLFDGQGPDHRVSLNLLVHSSVGGLRLLLPLGRRTVYLNPTRMMVSPGAWLDCVSRFGVTDAGMSCAMAAKINEVISQDEGDWDMSSLERLAFGSETITPSIIRRLVSNLESLGMRDASALLIYSMTETGPLFSSRLPVRQLFDAGVESDGCFRLTRCTDSWTIRIVRETGAIASQGEIGRIEVRSATRLFRGYHPDGDGPRVDGWFYTGDLGSLDERGLLLTGREKWTISINARKICSEDVERCLGRIDGIKPGLVFAAPFRGEESATDELAVFFSPHAFDEPHLAPMIPKMHSAVSKSLGVRISYLVPLAEEQIGRTATGKVKRSELVEGLRLGRWQPLKSASVSRGDVSQNFDWLSRQWRELLKLEYDPQGDQSFFDLGGDSLACAELLFAVEEEYRCRLSLDELFQEPTLSAMADLIRATATSSAKVAGDNGTASAYSLLHKMQSLSWSWRGERQFSDSLLVGFNTEGNRPPIFWVFQEYLEAWQLAEHLGPDQPLYAMRSCVGIISGQHYTAEVLETVCNRYLWEMLALPLCDAFVIGGNCQGGILALALARRLKHIGHPPLMLVLLEWNFSYSTYAEPTLLIHGDRSLTAAIYQRPETSAINWREDFPRSLVASIPARHGEVLKLGGGLVQLAKILREQTGRVVPVQRVGLQEDRRLELKLARRRAEAKELRAQLIQRELEVNELRTNLASQTRELRNLKASTIWRITTPLRQVAQRLGALMGRRSTPPQRLL